MCSAARSEQRLGAGFGAGPENDDDAKEFTTPVKVESFGDTRRFGLRRQTPVGCTAAQMLLLLLVDAWCSWRAPSTQNNAGVDAMNG
jgi:hypothetical protein